MKKFLKIKLSLICAFCLIICMVGGFTNATVSGSVASADSSDSGARYGSVATDISNSSSDGTQICNGSAIYVNGIKVSNGIQVGDATYIPIKTFLDAIGEQTNIAWNDKSNTLTVTAEGLNMTVTAGTNYMTANGRCFYLPHGVLNSNGSVALPISELAKVFQIDAAWDAANSSYSIKAINPKPIASSASVYNEKDLYWLSHLINAEAGNQPMRGKIAVGNVVLNRLSDPKCPKTVYDVIFDKRFGVQFSVIKGRIYDDPNDDSVAAAKMCLEGYDVVGNALYFVNPKLADSTWFSKTRTYVDTIGEHVFYS